MTAGETSDLLEDAICSLTTCLDKASESLSKDKTLFVTLDQNNFETNYYYHDKVVTSPNIALKRLYSILHSKPNIKKEIKKEIEIISLKKRLNEDPNSYDTKLEDAIQKALAYGPVKPRKRPYYSVAIKTKEMIYDTTDTKKLKCKECLKLYPSVTSLRNHFIRVHAPKIHKCPTCNKKFASLTLLEAHKKLSHCTVVCSECGKTFHNRHTLKMHEIGHHLKIVCQDCGRVYKSKTAYKKHKELNVCSQKTRASPANARFTCDYCNKKYTQKVSLRVHIQYEHCNYKGHVCKWCNKSFYAQSRLKAHIVKHTQEKNFPCNTCGGRFITKESLLYHTRIHTGERPYKCEYCDSRFLSASRRTDHVKRRHTSSSKMADGIILQWAEFKSK
ncbi:zinc finger protein 320-like isoform X2 [Pararge aegeria]|nr:zinc finger protein 320-like isoform X2 [Pararge aegeria]